MANITWTFNQPGAKLVLPDDYAALDANNSVTVDIRNSGSNYIVLPSLFEVHSKDGHRPGSNNGYYLTASEANAAKTSLLNTYYNGNEYTASDVIDVHSAGNSGAYILSNGIVVKEKSQPLTDYQSYWFTNLSTAFNNNPGALDSTYWLTVYHQTNSVYRYDYMIQGNDFYHGTLDYIYELTNAMSNSGLLTESGSLNYMQCSNFNPANLTDKEENPVLNASGQLYSRLNTLKNVSGSAAAAICQLRYSFVSVENVSLNSGQNFNIKAVAYKYNGQNPDSIVFSIPSEVIIKDVNGLEQGYTPSVIEIMVLSRNDGTGTKNVLLVK